MPTPTERHLQVIAEKIEIIQSIHAEVGFGALSVAQAQSVIGCLGAIRERVSRLPREFKRENCNIHWVSMSVYGMPWNFSANNFSSRALNTITVFFAEIKPQILHHAGGDTEIQKGVICNLQAQYEELSKNWHGSILLQYALISITSTLFVIRIGLVQDEINLTIGEIILYIAHVSIIFCMGMYIQLRKGNTSIANDIYSWHYTHTDFYNRSHR